MCVFFLYVDTNINFGSDMDSIGLSSIPLGKRIAKDCGCSSHFTSVLSSGVAMASLMGVPIIVWFMYINVPILHRFEWILLNTLIVSNSIVQKAPAVLYGSIRRPVWWEDFEHHRRGREAYLMGVHMAWTFLLLLLLIYVFFQFESSNLSWIELGGVLLAYALSFDKIQSAISIVAAYSVIAAYNITKHTKHVVYVKSRTPVIRRTASAMHVFGSKRDPERGVAPQLQVTRVVRRGGVSGRSLVDVSLSTGDATGGHYETRADRRLRLTGGGGFSESK